MLASHALDGPTFGLFTLVLLVAEIIEVTACAWIRVGLLRLDSSRTDRLGWAVGRSARLTFLCSGFAVLIAAVAAYGLAPSGEWRAFAFAAAGYIVTNAYLRLGLTALQLQGRRFRYAAIEGVRATMTFAVAAGLLKTGVKGYEPLVWSASAVAAVAAVAALALAEYSPRSGRLSANKDDLIDRIKFGIPFMVLTLLAYAVTSTDRLTLQVLLGPAQVGIYAAAYALARQPFDVLTTAINQGSFPELVRRYETEGSDAAGRLAASLLSAYVLLLGSGALALSVLARPFAALMLPQAYVEPAGGLMPLIAVAAVLLNLKTSVFDNVFHLRRKNWLQCLSFAPGAAVVLIASVVLVPRLGGLGAAVAMLLGAATGLVGSAWLSARLMRIDLEVGELGKSLIVALATGSGAWFGADWIEGGALSQLGAGAAAGLLTGAVALALLRPRAIRSFSTSQPPPI